MDFNRRNLLCGLGGLAVGGMVCGMSCSSYAAGSGKAPGVAVFAQVNGDARDPHKLDPAESQQIAYDGYWYKGYACRLRHIYGIVGVMGEKIRCPLQPVPLYHARSQQGRRIGLGHNLRRALWRGCRFRAFYPRKERNPMVNELLPLV